MSFLGCTFLEIRYNPPVNYNNNFNLGPGGAELVEEHADVVVETLPEEEEEKEEGEPSLSRSFGIRSWLQDVLETLLLAVILFLVINTLTGRYQVHGQSMEPSLHDGQYLIASKVVYWLHPPDRGDVIVLDPPGEQSAVPYIKRVIGLPGDKCRRAPRPPPDKP